MEELFERFYQTSGVCTDTRKIEKNCLFIALKGDHFNGNEYAIDALEKGAQFAIVDEEKYANNTTIFLVNDGLLFLQKLATHHRDQFQIPLIGITGSNGKTTTKELIASILSEKFNALFTKGNLNNHIGVPLTLLQLNKSHNIAIIEMGASKPGDIQELTDIAHPTHGIITNIGVAHLEGMGSRENILQTKTALYRFLNSQTGHIFYNLDDKTLEKEVLNQCSTSTYGTSNAADITGTLLKVNPEVHLKWKSADYQSQELETQIIGKYNFSNMLAAICIGTYFKVPNKKINKAIQNYAPSNNRSQIQKTKHNTLILDAYNANPTSVQSALKSFATIESENKLFVLGDMLELGDEKNKFHEEIIALSKELQLQGIFVGKLFSNIAKKDKNIISFPTIKEAEEFLQTAQPKKNLILLKGSRGIQLEKLTDVL